MTPRCGWPKCDADAAGPVVHEPTGTDYCEEHAPDVDGETWVIP